jgi:hypothetical protein
MLREQYKYVTSEPKYENKCKTTKLYYDVHCNLNYNAAGRKGATMGWSSRSDKEMRNAYTILDYTDFGK